MANNLKHYIDGIKNGDVFFDEKFKMTTALKMAGLLHAVFLVLFLIMGVIPLVVYQVFAVALYFVLPLLVKKGKLRTTTAITVFEVILNVIICSLFTGRSTGFHIYLIGILPICFYMVLICQSFKKKELASLGYSALAFISYIGVYVLSKLVEPIHPISDSWQIALMFVNICAGFLVMALFLFLIQWDVLYRNTSMDNKNSILNEMANKDALTKLYNRRFMDKKLDDKLTDLNERGEIFGIIMGDIDNFKRINDTYGHECGDEVLVGVAEVLTKSVRDRDIVCRWGGEEFLVIISGNKKITADVAERMRAMIGEKEFMLGKEKVNITMTFGVAESIPGFSIDKLVQIADDNLYKGKQNGKNQVVS